MTSTRDLEAVAPERAAKVIAYNLGLVDLFAAQVLQTDRAALSVTPTTRRLLLNALMQYRRALTGDDRDEMVGVPIVDVPRAHPLLDDHMRERAAYLKAVTLAEESRDQGRSLGRAETRREVEARDQQIGRLEDEVGKLRAQAKRRRRR